MHATTVTAPPDVGAYALRLMPIFQGQVTGGSPANRTLLIRAINAYDNLYASTTEIYGRSTPGHETLLRARRR